MATALAQQLFPDEPLTQQYADQVIEVLRQAGLDPFIPLTIENIGALIQTFDHGSTDQQFDLMQQAILFHFTYEHTIQALRESDKVGEIANPNAVDEINAVTGGIDGGFTFALPDPGTTPGIGDTDPGTVEGRDQDGNIIRSTGILGGGTLTRVQRAGREDLYFQVYRVPNSNQFVYYQFDPIDVRGAEDENGNPIGDGIPDQIAETFGGLLPTVVVFTEDQFAARDNVDMFFAGEAVDVAGITGNFTQLWYEEQRQALNAAGITDPGLQGRLLSDPEYANLVTRASLPGAVITPEQLRAELRGMAVYQEIYPGINFFLDRGDENPEAAWRTYQSNVEPLLRELGFAPDEDGTFRTTIVDLLDSRVSAEELREFTPTLKRIQQNPDLKPLMDEWAQRELGRALDFNEFIDVLEGTTDPELNRVVEAATLAFAAERAGLNVSVEDIRGIADAVDLTPEAALRAFTDADKALLAIGETELAGFGAQRGDFLDVAVGRAPRSGLSRAAVLNLQDKLATERGLSDDPRAGFFLGFSRSGQPQRQGLGPLALEGG